MTATRTLTTAPSESRRAAPSLPPARSARAQRRWGRVFLYLALSLFGIVFLFPLVFMFVSSLKPDSQILQDIDSAAAFLPVGDISLDNYFGVFDRVPVAQFMFNSVLVTVLTVGLGLIVNSMAGFALSRLAWKGRIIVLAIIIATLIVPFETIAVPMVYWVAQLPTLVMEGGVLKYDFGWLNTYQVQIVPFIANAFSIFLFTQYFSTIPKSLDEAARIDGASWFTIYRRILVPLSGPAFATVAILTFLPAWNQYLWPLMVVQKEELRPVMVGVQYFFQLNTAWGEVMAYTSLITIPVLIVFLIFQRAFVSSIAASGVKG
ncbi:carbohydrate ABC transporter permease [Microbacterium trichothecenolyticum]|uniref:Carbohydrate ABC transporter permease n=1 Tax=Microbacterium ureisolvens TaxID=2781186 RepID=A0ABS7I4R3_9MICO|nr:MULTISPECIES: carbohydrate ABC transporter permease [Microbacterium]MBW9111707.1 carbohydrate ABC transporter permease [Microbacterium ureisolvens]MBW9119479.1 carbohydrate ABC transporter permease [Microbacterium trichothecenolyticum]